MTVDQGNDHAKPYERGFADGRADALAAAEQALPDCENFAPPRDCGRSEAHPDSVYPARFRCLVCRIRRLLADNGAAALREVKARAWDEGCTHHTTDPVPCLMNPYRDTDGGDDGAE